MAGTSSKTTGNADVKDISPGGTKAKPGGKTEHKVQSGDRNDAPTKSETRINKSGK